MGKVNGCKILMIENHTGESVHFSVNEIIFNFREGVGMTDKFILSGEAKKKPLKNKQEHSVSHDTISLCLQWDRLSMMSEAFFRLKRCHDGFPVLNFW